MTSREAFSCAGCRGLLATLTVLTSIAGIYAMLRSLPPGEPAWLATALVIVFAILFGLVSFSFWMATIGFAWALATQAKRAERAAGRPGGGPLRTKTAILMPIYNESPHRVFGGLRAIYESLEATGQGKAFDFFVLSDTTDPDLWLAEELAWARLNQAIGDGSRVYYRHRPKNTGRKAGNIADFCQRWGSAYRNMVVLDADSVMSGETLVEMARRMDDDPQLGILQAPPVPVNQVSLFARCQQFAARVYSPVFLRGFASWAHNDGNYWGHNAIIRVDAFIASCGLSRLPGKEPLGGEILSHDFVEAALMRKAGYKVVLAQELDGSYEECPTNLIDYAKRDQRWCQGNMQHIRLVFSAGMHPISRLHLGLGAMSYLSSPLWVLFLLLSFLSAVISRSRADGAIAGTQSRWAMGLFVGTMLMLLVPKLWGYLLLIADRSQRARCGGALKAGAGVLIETIVSMLISPVMMAYHTIFVLATFRGRRIEWVAQRRGDQDQQISAAIAAHWKQTLTGLAAGAVVWALTPELLAWLSPVLAGLILSVPLSMILASTATGRALGSRGLLTTADETAVPQVLQRHRHLIGVSPGKELTDLGGIFRRILADPAFVALHRSILLATDAATRADERHIRLAETQLLTGGPAHVALEHRRAILGDPIALQALHVFAWTRTRKSDSER